MVMCDYFSAASDDQALSVLDRSGGPVPSVFDAVSLKGIDPVVTIAQLEAILTGCSYDEACTRPRAGDVLSPPEDGDPFVVSVSDTLQRALASASDDQLTEAAESWARTEELRDWVSAEVLLDVLFLLAGLARRAEAEDKRLYCWWAL